MKTTFVKRILGVVLAAVTVVSLFAMAAPIGVSAATQGWSKLPTPDSTGLVMPYVRNAAGAAYDIAIKGPMAQASDGSALWVAVNMQQTLPAAGGFSNYIIKSTDGGRTWPSAGWVNIGGTLNTGIVTAMAASPTEPGVLYYAANDLTTGSPTVYKSTDGGATFVPKANIASTVASRINSMAVAIWGGRYIVVIGTTGAGANPGDVYFMDENDLYFNLTMAGTNDFAFAEGLGAGSSVIAVALSPTFATDRCTAAIGTNGTTSIVGVNFGGGAWNAVIPNSGAITNANTGTAVWPATTGNGTGAIAFTSDFNVTTNPNFFFGLGGTSGQGVYRFAGGTVTPFVASTATLLSTSALVGSTFDRTVVSLDAFGTIAATTIYAGNQTGGIMSTKDSGASWSGKQLDVAPTANRVYVQIKNVAANAPLYILVGSTYTTIGTDDTAFWYLSGTAYHALSLIGNGQTVNTLVGTPNSELFMSTTGAGPAAITNDSFNIYAGGIGSGDSYTITSGAGVTGDAFTMTGVMVTVSGSLTATNLSPAITGGSGFVPGMVGFTINIDAVPYTILSVTSNSALTLSANYGGVTGVHGFSIDYTNTICLINVTSGDVAVSQTGGAYINLDSMTGTATATITHVTSGHFVSVIYHSATPSVVTVTANAVTYIQWSIAQGVVPTVLTTADSNTSMTVLGSGAPFWMDMNSAQYHISSTAGTGTDTVTIVDTTVPATPVTLFSGTLATLNALNGSTGYLWTSAAGQVITVTLASADTVLVTMNNVISAGTGTSTAAETNDPNGSQTLSALTGTFTASGMDVNTTEVVTVAWTGGGYLLLTPSVSGILVPAAASPPVPTLTGATITFTSSSPQQSVNVAYASGSITGITVTGPTGATLSPVVVTGTVPTNRLSMKIGTDNNVAFVPVWGTPFGTSASTFNSNTTYPDFLWRYFSTGGVFYWERVYSVTSSTIPAPIIGTIVIDPAYATSKALFFFKQGTKPLYVSTNNGDSFSSTAWSNNNNIRSLYVLSATSVLIGDTSNGNIYQSANSGFTWTTGAAFGAGFSVDQIISAGGSNLLAVAHTASVVEVAQGVIGSTGAVTWTTINIPGALTPTPASILPAPASVSNTFIQTAADYATNHLIFVTVSATTGSGVFRYNVTVPTTVVGTNGWTKVDDGTSPNDALGPNGAVGMSAAPGGVAGAVDGSGLIYVADNSNPNGDVMRIRGLEATSEILDSGTVSALPGIALRALVVDAASTNGNVLIYALGGNDNFAGSGYGIVWTYTDTLGKQGTGVVVANLATGPSIITWLSLYSSSCTVTFNNMPNATDYRVSISINPITSYYVPALVGSSFIESVNGGGLSNLVIPIAGSTTSTAVITGMNPGTLYYISVWALCDNTVTYTDNLPMTSFMYAGTSSFTTPLAYPTTPMNLVPILGATNVPVQPNFAWAAVTGATAYTLDITTATDVNFASPVYHNATIPAVVGQPTVTWNYTGAALANNTSYIWRVKATGSTSAWVYGNFTTIPAVVPPVTVTNPPAITLTQAAPGTVPTIIITQGPAVTVTVGSPVTPVITFPGLTVTQLPAETPPTPLYIWIIVGVGGLLTLAVIILIIRTRRVV